MSEFGTIVGYTAVSPYAYQGVKRGYRGKEDFKPGLIFPEQEKKNNTAKNVVLGLGTAAAIALAIIFRGKIKAGALKLYSKAKPYADKALNFAKPYYTKAKNAVTGLAQKVVQFFKKAPAAPTP